MSNLFKYKIALDADLATEEKDKQNFPQTISYLAFILVCTIITSVFSAIVMILNYCSPGSLDGTYLKLFF